MSGTTSSSNASGRQIASCPSPRVPPREVVSLNGSNSHQIETLLYISVKINASPANKRRGSMSPTPRARSTCEPVLQAFFLYDQRKTNLSV